LLRAKTNLNYDSLWYLSASFCLLHFSQWPLCHFSRSIFTSCYKFVYECHVEALDRVWRSYDFDLSFVFGDFNIPNINWSVCDSGLVYTGGITDKARVIGDRFSLLHFVQKNQILNNTGSLFDLIFTHNESTHVQQATAILVPCDIYHPALSIFCPFPSAFPMLDTQHTYYDLKNANYKRIIQRLEQWFSTGRYRPPVGGEVSLGALNYFWVVGGWWTSFGW
jgi:hypothetical protein